jgi:malate dehydrogenase
MGVISEGGKYGIEDGLMFSVPVKTNGFEWTVHEGLNIDEFSREKINVTMNELKEEKAEALA